MDTKPFEILYIGQKYFQIIYDLYFVDERKGKFETFDRNTFQVKKSCLGDICQKLGITHGDLASHLQVPSHDIEQFFTKATNPGYLHKTLHSNHEKIHKIRKTTLKKSSNNLAFLITFLRELKINIFDLIDAYQIENLPNLITLFRDLPTQFLDYRVSFKHLDHFLHKLTNPQFTNQYNDYFCYHNSDLLKQFQDSESLPVLLQQELDAVIKQTEDVSVLSNYLNKARGLEPLTLLVNGILNSYQKECNTPVQVKELLRHKYKIQFSHLHQLDKVFDCTFYDNSLAILEAKANWIHILKFLREQLTCPIVVIGNDDPSKCQATFELGGNDYIVSNLEQDDSIPYYSFNRYQFRKQLDQWMKTGTTSSLVDKSYLTLDLDNHSFQDQVNLPCLHQMHNASKNNRNVLILGETGTGKNIVARLIHNNSDRADGAFVSLNCASLSPTLIQSELFGYEKDSHNVASETKDGLIKSAHGGTLFLNEIGEISMEIQSNLLDVLETKQFFRVGGTKPIYSDFRLIAATNKDLNQAIRAGTFREDLFYRLAQIKIEVPPLRTRPKDLESVFWDQWNTHSSMHFYKELKKIFYSNACVSVSGSEELRNQFISLIHEADKGANKHLFQENRQLLVYDAKNSHEDFHDKVAKCQGGTLEIRNVCKKRSDFQIRLLEQVKQIYQQENALPQMGARLIFTFDKEVDEKDKQENGEKSALHPNLGHWLDSKAVKVSIDKQNIQTLLQESKALSNGFFMSHEESIVFHNSLFRNQKFFTRSHELVPLLQQCEWKGNFRELFNVLNVIFEEAQPDPIETNIYHILTESLPNEILNQIRMKTLRPLQEKTASYENFEMMLQQYFEKHIINVPYKELEEKLFFSYTQYHIESSNTKVEALKKIDVKRSTYFKRKNERNSKTT